MTENDQEAARLRHDTVNFAMEVGVMKASMAAAGVAVPGLDEVAARANTAMVRAAAVDQPEALTAAMEHVSPDEFKQRVQRRRRRDALHKRMARARAKARAKQPFGPVAKTKADSTVAARRG
jgi:hypothetical protein